MVRDCSFLLPSALALAAHLLKGSESVLVRVRTGPYLLKGSESVLVVDEGDPRLDVAAVVVRAEFERLAVVGQRQRILV